MGSLLEQVVRALSGRYAVEREIGSGAMATVFLASDEKHRRPVAIKVLRPAVAAALGAERFLREIEIAAHLNHPHILPLHDSGEADGLLYYVMPYVEGESLRDRLERAHELSIGEAVRIAGQVAAALDYAHGHGIVHRDIKPANILLSSGEAVVADFGIARAFDVASLRLTEVGTAPGTLFYMSPEQAAAGEVDGRSDVYSLGCVLFEMLAGTPPYRGASAAVILGLQAGPPPSIRRVRDTVPASLEAVVQRALARLPADRFATGAEFAEALAPFATGTRPATRLPATRGRLRRVGVGTVAALVLASVAILLFTRESGGIDFQERDWIVIADLENATGDPVFDRSLNTALTVAVEQSRYVNVYPRARVAETLRRMGREGDAALDPDLAREVAIRESLEAVLTFEIAALDTVYMLTTRLVEPHTSVTVESETVRAVGKAEVLEGVDELARRLRANLGESVRAIRRSSVPLPLATTSSLDALKRFADGSALWSASQWTDARAMWQEAVALDSSFAWAHASLGLAQDWLEGRGAGQSHFAAAEHLLDRVTEKERLWIRALISDGEDAVTALRAYTQHWPDDRDAWYNLGNNLRYVNRSEEALDAYQRAMAVDSMCSWCFVNAAMVHQVLGRSTESAAAFERAFALDPQGRTQPLGDLNRTYGFVLVALGDTARARSLFEDLLPLDPDRRANGLRSLALLSMYRGRIDDGILKLRQAIALNETTDEPLSEYRNRLYLASLHDLRGSLGDASAERRRAERIARRIHAPGYWLAFLAKQYARTGAVERADSILALMEDDAGAQPSVSTRAQLLHARGEIAMARGDHEAARTALETAHGLWKLPDRLESVAHAAARAGRLRDAEAVFRVYLSDARLGDENQAYWILAHAHMGDVLDQLGDTPGAATYYRLFLDLWGEGDADLPAVVTVRERLARLAAEGVSRPEAGPPRGGPASLPAPVPS